MIHPDALNAEMAEIRHEILRLIPARSIAGWIMVPVLRCQRCGNTFEGRGVWNRVTKKAKRPACCPNCRQTKWDTVARGYKRPMKRAQAQPQQSEGDQDGN